MFLSRHLSRRFSSTLCSSSHDRIGFIGLGNMGQHMCRNILERHSGAKLCIHDVNPESTTALSSKFGNRVIVANHPKQVAQSSTVIITMVPNSSHVQSVVLGKEGVLEGWQPGSLFIDSSTIAPSTSQEIQAKLKPGVVVDAPVSGGVPGAEQGTLTFMVGASNLEEFEKVKPILQLMGKNIVYCGQPGSGQVAKLCNNMLLACSMVAVSEAMVLGIKSGLDPKVLANIFNTSTGRCWSSDTYNPCPGILPQAPASRGYTGGFGAHLTAKDLRLAVEQAGLVKSPVFSGALAKQIYTMVEKDYPGLDFSVVYQWLLGKES